ncbi:phage tail assembly chaperone [Ochrobactrum sp. CM-21-5]|nr:rcc01693 family protein [Ochrobactrum sp. CM-21-5]MBC2884742.1 phage tail assembly chaperone [Ochrobactrum sp. CM-21-5]
MNAAVESKHAPQPFPWDEVMRAGFGLLRLSSQSLWSMTPRELAAALRPVVRTDDAPSRQTLDALMRAFPDK